jgi:acyl-CoA thioesterase FadM
MQYLISHGYEELNIEGTGLIMSDAAIEFKSELFYGDIIKVFVTSGNFSTVAFDLFYRVEKAMERGAVVVAIAKTGMVCYDYGKKKIVAFPLEAKSRLTQVM